MWLRYYAKLFNSRLVVRELQLDVISTSLSLRCRAGHQVTVASTNNTAAKKESCQCDFSE